MKNLNETKPLTFAVITRTSRKCIVNDVSELITLYETTTKVEISIPPILSELKRRFCDALSALFLPKFCVV